MERLVWKKKKREREREKFGLVSDPSRKHSSWGGGGSLAVQRGAGPTAASVQSLAGSP